MPRAEVSCGLKHCVFMSTPVTQAAVLSTDPLRREGKASVL